MNHALPDPLLDIPPVRLGNALSTLYLAIVKWSATCHQLERPDCGPIIEKLQSERESAVFEVRNWINIALDEVPGTDEWVRPIKGTKPGEYTSQIKHLLIRLGSDTVCSCGYLPSHDDERREFGARLEQLGKLQLELRLHLDYSAVKPVGEVAAQIRRVKEVLALASSANALSPRDRLLLNLAQRSNHRCLVTDLPEELRDADVLTVMDADRLIEFGRRKHCHVGQYRLVVERGWDFVSVTGPHNNSMQKFLDEVMAEPESSPIRHHVQLTAQGRIEASRLGLAHRAVEPKSVQPQRAHRKLSERDHQERSRKISEYIRKQAESGREMRTITREEIERETHVPATYISSTVAWKALARQKATSAKPLNRTKPKPQETPDEIASHAEYERMLEEAGRTGDWSKVEKEADRQIKGQ